MGENSKIEWTDHTFNPWIGCTKVHSGCAHCYAESHAKRTGQAIWGPSGSRVKTSPANWAKPLKWNKEAVAAGVRARVFCASLADVFEDWQGNIHSHERDEYGRAVLWWRNDIGACTAGQTTLNNSRGERLATMSDLRADLFKLIDATPNLDWLLLTKRPENIHKMWPGANGAKCRCGRFVKFDLPMGLLGGLCGCGERVCGGAQQVQPRPNVWLGTSISDQPTADKFIPELLKCRDLSPVLFLSAEPLLGPVDLSRWTEEGLECDCGWSGREDQCERIDIPDDWYYRCPECGEQTAHTPLDELLGEGINWVIAGGESDHHARPMHPDWARSLRDQCQAAGVPFLFKQWGEFAPGALHGDWIGVANDASLLVDDPRLSVVEMSRVGKAAAGRLLDGRTHDAFPEVAHADSHSA